MNWQPVNLKELKQSIYLSEKQMTKEQFNFWNLVKIKPEKWQESTYGQEGNGFWIVGLIGNNVIYYNDIEEGFNVSNWSSYGLIDEYYCNQDELHWTINKLLQAINNSGQIEGRLGPPKKLK
jgi:hypothetical protein